MKATKEQIERIAEEYDWETLDIVAELLWFMYFELDADVYAVWDAIADAQELRADLDYEEEKKREEERK